MEEKKSSTKKRDAKLKEKLENKTPDKIVRFEQDPNLMKPESAYKTKKLSAHTLLPDFQGNVAPILSANPVKRQRGHKGIIAEE